MRRTCTCTLRSPNPLPTSLHLLSRAACKTAEAEHRATQGDLSDVRAREQQLQKDKAALDALAKENARRAEDRAQAAKKAEEALQRVRGVLARDAQTLAQVASSVQAQANVG